MKRFNQKSLTFSIVFLFLYGVVAQAQLTDITHSKDAIYIEIGDCVQQYEYTYTDKKSYKTAYYDYHVALNDFETAIFKVSKYASETVGKNQLPQKNILSCKNNLGKIFDEALLEAVRTTKRDVYLIRKTAKGYEVGRAINAAYAVYLPKDKYYRYVGKEYGFDYDGTKDYNPGDELLQNPQEGMGNFAYRSNSQMNCLHKADFMRIPVNFMQSTDIEFVLGIGLVREYSDNMERRLVAVDGQPYEMLIAEKCNITPITEAVVNNNRTPKIETDVELGDEMASRTGEEDKVVREKVVIPPPVRRTEPIVTTTTTEEGDFGDLDEPLVEAFTGTHTISSDLVEPDLTDVIESEGQTAKSGDETIKTDIDGIIIEGVYEPKPTLDKPNVTTKGVKYHTVEQGETLYRISKMYKVTVKQLKDWNKLESNTIEIDQKLRVK